MSGHNPGNHGPGHTAGQGQGNGQHQAQAPNQNQNLLPNPSSRGPRNLHIAHRRSPSELTPLMGEYHRRCHSPEPSLRADTTPKHMRSRQATHDFSVAARKPHLASNQCVGMTSQSPQLGIRASPRSQHKSTTCRPTNPRLAARDTQMRPTVSSRIFSTSTSY